jgi:hypothetical protein
LPSAIRPITVCPCSFIPRVRFPCSSAAAIAFGIALTTLIACLATIAQTVREERTR